MKRGKTEVKYLIDLLYSTTFKFGVMSSHRYSYSRPIEEEEFDDTELETPVRGLNPLDIKRSQQYTNGIYRSFRAVQVDVQSTSNKVDGSGYPKSHENNGKSGDDALDCTIDNLHDGLTIKSPPSLKFDKSVTLDDGKHDKQRKNDSPTPRTRSKPTTVDFSPIDYSPVAFKVIKPNTGRKEATKTKRKEQVSETPILNIYIDNDDVKQSILDRVNTTLESLKKKTPTDQGKNAFDELNPLPVKPQIRHANKENTQPMYNYEVEEPDFVHISRRNSRGLDDKVTLHEDELHFVPMTHHDKTPNNGTKLISLLDEVTLGNSTPVSKPNILRVSNVNREHKLYEAEVSHANGASTWWTAKQWLKLMKVVNLKVISRNDAINSKLLMKELGCLSKIDLERRYDFLKHYKTK